ncbi:MAG: hypothetical protein QMC38_09920, partial [Sinobacterium sp.]
MAKFSQRMNDIEPFRVVEVLTRAKELEAQGRSIMHLEAGEPDFDTAKPIVDAGIAALQAAAAAAGCRGRRSDSQPGQTCTRRRTRPRSLRPQH